MYQQSFTTKGIAEIHTKLEMQEVLLLPEVFR